MPQAGDEALAREILQRGKATAEQMNEAKDLAAKMRALGLKKDVLDALVERGVISIADARSIRSGAAPESDVLRLAPEPGPIGVATPSGGRGPARPAPGRPSQQLPPCANHPHMPGIFKCVVCGKSVCMQCAVRTSKGLYCSQECMSGESLERGAAARTGGSLTGLPPAAVAGGVVSLVILAVIVIVVMGPSKELSRARDLKAAVRQYEEEGKPEEALSAAEDLATMIVATDEPEFKELTAWGEARAEALRPDVAQAELDALADGREHIEALDTAELARYERDLKDFVGRHSRIQRVRARAETLLKSTRARLQSIESKGKETVLDARLAAAETALDKAKIEVEALMRRSRYGEALDVIERHGRNVPLDLRAAREKELDRLKEDTLASARAAYERKEAAARELVWKKRYEDAAEIFREVVDNYGVEEIVARARKSLGHISSARARASAGSKRNDLGTVNRALALVEVKLRELDYVGAMLEIENVTPDIRQADAKARLAAISESIQHDEEAFLAILDMIGKGPVSLGKIRDAGSGEIIEATSTHYTVRATGRRKGDMKSRMRWAAMPATEICKLAEMAASDDVGSLVNLALFCAGRGAHHEYVAARRRATVAARGGKDPLERFEMRFENLKPGAAPPPPKAAAPKESRASEEPAVKTPPRETAARGEEGARGGEEADKADEDATQAAGEGKEERPKPPATIEKDCPYCKGTGMVEKIGCGKCRGTCFEGGDKCSGCGGSGRCSYDCRNCGGQGFFIAEGRRRDCPICRGKGHPPCGFCRGSGKVKVPNPDASPLPTVTCPYCDGSRYNTKLKCKICGGSGRKKSRWVEGNVFWEGRTTCRLCEGTGKGPPVCPVCNGKAYVGSGDSPKCCRKCVGTGHLYLPCKGCRGRGWIATKKGTR